MSPTAGGLLLLLLLLACLSSEGATEEGVAECTKLRIEMMSLMKESISSLENRLLSKIQRQQLEIDKLKKQLLVSTEPHEGRRLKKRSSDSPSVNGRSCAELLSIDPSLPSGSYKIDPDGHGTGDDPFEVFCNMTTGATLVSHDTRNVHSIRPCSGLGNCYTRDVAYGNATMKQLVALTKLSSTCSQTIKYECQQAPLLATGDYQSFWRDRNGDTRYDWTGTNPNQHRTMCQCGLTGTCRNSTMSPCNCNSGPLGRRAVDVNVIADKNSLPVTRLTFRLNPSSAISQANYTLSPLKCSGLDGLRPSSCLDLWRAGHSLNGFYSVQKGGNSLGAVKTIYCDFQLLGPPTNEVDNFIPSKIRRLLTEMKAQLEAIGNQSRVYFDVFRTGGFRGDSGETVTYQGVNVNVGNAMNPKDGTFTAPNDGVYMFSYTAIKLENSFNLRFFIQRNGVTVSTAYGAADGNISIPLSMFTIQQLNKGDKVNVVLSTGQSYDTPNEMITHFSGALLV